MERKHKHLLETARAIFFQSKVPTRFWGKCLLYATHLINRMPLSSVHSHSPYELLYGSKPSLAYLKVFGCLCYVSTIKAHRTKFDPRATPCIFLGYPPRQKAYRVYDLENHKFIISRDLVFHEKHLPCHHSSSTSIKHNSHPIFLPAHTIYDMDSPFKFPDPFHFPASSNTPFTSEPPASSIPTTSISSSPSLHITNSISPSIPEPPPRLSTRPKQSPKYLDSYVCTATNITSHWCNIVIYDHLAQSNKALIS